MKKIAAFALTLSLISTAASAVVIDVTVEGVTRRIDCGTAANLAASGLPEADVNACRQFFETTAGAGGAGGAGTAAGAFGVGGAGGLALAALGIALVAGFGGSNSDTTSGSSSNSTTN